MSDSKSTVSMSDGRVQELYLQASKARNLAYSPYSGHKVGAAIRTTDGKIFSGCNIENSSYGATLCAERVAIHKAISELGSIQISEILVITEATPPWPPCGLCRQVISEFGKNPKVYLTNTEGMLETMTFADIYPNAFTPAHLKK